MEYLDPRPWAPRDVHYSRHACHEYRRPLLSEQVSVEISPGGIKREKSEVPGGLPPEVPQPFPLSHIGRQTHWLVGRGHSKTPLHYPINQVERTLLLDVWLIQEWDRDHNGAINPPLYPGI